MDQCLRSLPQGCKILCVDSGSQDKTCVIAKSYSATVVQHEFKDFADQRNYAISKVETSWVLMVDSDEVLSNSMSQQIIETVNSSQNTEHAFALQRKLIFLHRKLRYGRSSDYPVRLFQKEKIRYHGSVHESLVLIGTTQSPRVHKMSEGELYHYSYENLDDYFKKFNRYTTLIAEEKYKKGRKVGRFFGLRFFVEFFNRYFVRLGCLDGQAGFCYALLSSVYAYTKYAKTYENQLNLRRGSLG